MHVRFSSCIGLPVLEDGAEHVLGRVSGILIHPDTGRIEGFFVRGAHGEQLFFSVLDIARFTTRVYLRDASVLAPAQERIRLQKLLEDPRTFLRQKIRTESGTTLGRCADVQFNTVSMHVEWLFPRRWFSWGIALPVSEVVEVKSEAIIVRDPAVSAPEPEVEPEAREGVPAFPEVAELG